MLEFKDQNKVEKFIEHTNCMTTVINKIAEPLMNHTKIINISYLKFFKDGNVINFSTNINYIKYRFKEQIAYQILFSSELENQAINIPLMYLWPQNSNSKLLSSLAINGIGNGCNIFIKSLEYIEVYSFATNTENINMQNFYINNFGLLKRFIIHFNENINSLLNNNHKILTSINFPKQNIIKNKTNASNYMPNLLKKIQFTENTNFSIKELESCYYLSQGFSIKAVAKKMNLSPRTVETHINNTKIKCNCLNKSQLLNFLNKKKWILETIFDNFKL